MTDEPKIVYQLFVKIVSPNHQDSFTITADDPEDLRPRAGKTTAWERYGDEDDYIEVLGKQVVRRELNKIEMKPVESLKMLLAEEIERWPEDDPYRTLVQDMINEIGASRT